MTVYIHRDGYRTVPKWLHYCARMNALCEQEIGGTVPQIVKSHRRQFGHFQEPLVVSMQCNRHRLLGGADAYRKPEGPVCLLSLNRRYSGPPWSQR